MRMIVAAAIVLAGLAGGLALGAVMRPEPGAGARDAAAGGAEGHGAESPAGGSAAQGQDAAGGSADDHGTPRDAGDSGAAAGQDRNYVKIGRQIIVPVVRGGETRALMLFDLALDVPVAMTELSYAAEPRLRDAFLRELFEMSYTGAFLGDYTDERVVDELRVRLRAAARRILGNAVAEVLILDILRQTM